MWSWPCCAGDPHVGSSGVVCSTTIRLHQLVFPFHLFHSEKMRMHSYTAIRVAPNRGACLPYLLTSGGGSQQQQQGTEEQQQPTTDGSSSGSWNNRQAEETSIIETAAARRQLFSS
eukprot:GHVS01028120.1.p5 GENE.GHVS01028120.1~~GHVS01028120.1.p5  ORF type:complete len:116 (+),score=38.45 GHVS01028120.1:912-1259(+)